MVELQIVCCYLALKFCVVFEYIVKFSFAQSEGVHVHQCFVGELGLVAIEVLIPADDCFGTEFHMEIFFA